MSHNWFQYYLSHYYFNWTVKNCIPCVHFIRKKTNLTFQSNWKTKTITTRELHLVQKLFWIQKKMVRKFKWWNLRFVQFDTAQIFVLHLLNWPLSNYICVTMDGIEVNLFPQLNNFRLLLLMTLNCRRDQKHSCLTNTSNTLLIMEMIKTTM